MTSGINNLPNFEVNVKTHLGAREGGYTVLSAARHWTPAGRVASRFTYAGGMEV